MNAIGIGAIAFLAEGLGLGIGMLALYLFHIKNKRIIGMLFGATSGLMIAIICFDLLPDGLALGNPLLLVAGIGTGLGSGVVLGELSHRLIQRMPSKQNTGLGMAVALTLGIALHNIPEGFALGTVAATTPSAINHFVLVLFLHSIPEGIAIAIPIQQEFGSIREVLRIPITLGFIMGIGAFIGYVLSQVSTTFVVFTLGTAGGIILFIVCEELLPESRKIWNGRLTSIATVIGIILGMLLVGH